MWWRNSLLVLALSLTACGFEPVYAKRGGESPALASVKVDAAPADPLYRYPAQVYTNALEDHLRSSGTPAYTLRSIINIQEAAIAISRDGTVSRYNILAEADLTLTRLSDGAIVYRGKSKRSGSYNNLVNAFYSTYASKDDAIKRTVLELAEDTRLKLAAYLAQPELFKTSTP